MKTIRNILICIIALLGMVACNERIEEAGTTTDGDKVGVNLSIIIPKLPQANTSTRTMAENPQLNNLYLAVFDKEGYLLDYVKATVTDDQLATANNVEYAYSVNLPSTSEKTIVHFIGNAPESIRFGTETEVIATMTTSGAEDAYWQKVELEQGTKGADVNQTMTNIPLIRNFAWILLTEETTNFTLESYCVLNKRTMGSVAPYNTQTRAFANYGGEVTLENLRTTQQYDAFVPAEAELDMDIPEEASWTKVNGETETNPCFIYERETPRTSPMVILMKGKYTGVQGDRYYKIDLRDTDGQYFPILRNFRYTMTVTQIDHPGYESALEAANGAGSGDVSQSIETESFNNISDGTVRMFVSYTDTTLVSSNPVTLKYKFIKFDENGSETVHNDKVTITKETFLEGGEVISGNPEKATADENDWRTITIQPTTPGNVPKIQTLLLKGEVTIDNKTYTLQRRVRFILRQPMVMSLLCDPQAIKRNVGEPFDLILKVPGGLGKALFPLNFELEATNQSITPDKGDDLPVVTGYSIVPEQSSKITIGFIKSLSWQEYEAAANVGGTKSISCHFKSSKAESATKIWAKNEYFNLASTDLSNYTPKEFSNLRFSESSVPFGRGQHIDFSFDIEGPQMPAQGVKVTLDGLEPAPDETRLTYVGVVDDKAQYYFSQGLQTTNNTLKLVTLYDDQSVSVKLEAFQYNEASASLDFDYETFSNLTFNPGSIPVGAATNVTFTFNMSKETENVIVTLTGGLKPAETNSGLTSMGGDRYSFKPTGIRNNTIHLVSTTFVTGENPKVTLEAVGFETASKEASYKWTIPAGAINVGNNSNISSWSNTTFYVYSTNPGSSYNPSGLITSFDAKRNGTNPNAIELTQTQYNAIISNGGYVYIRFGYYRNYHVAQVELSDLLDGGATLKFD